MHNFGADWFLDLLALFHLDGRSRWNRFVTGTTYRWVLFASHKTIYVKSFPWKRDENTCFKSDVSIINSSEKMKWFIHQSYFYIRRRCIFAKFIFILYKNARLSVLIQRNSTSLSRIFWSFLVNSFLRFEVSIIHVLIEIFRWFKHFQSHSN